MMTEYAVDVTTLKAPKDKAILRLEKKDQVYQTTGGVWVSMVGQMRSKRYHAELDFEFGEVLALGEGDFEPVEVGDRVMVRAISGGAAGADISREVGEERGTVIVVLRDEIVAKVG